MKKAFAFLIGLLFDDLRLSAGLAASIAATAVCARASGGAAWTGWLFGALATVSLGVSLFAEKRKEKP